MRHRRGSRGEETYRHGTGYAPAFKRRVVDAVADGTPVSEAAQAFGVGEKTVYNWLRAFERQGAQGLEPRAPGRKVELPRRQDVRRERVLTRKAQHPEWGARRIRDVLARFEALGVSESLVRRVLHEAGWLEDKPPQVEKPPRPETRFERARPNQLGQSDFFTFLLRRHARVYVAAFLDDYSRFVVGCVVAHHQKGSLVLCAAPALMSGLRPLK